MTSPAATASAPRPPVAESLTAYLEALLARQGQVSWLVRAGTAAAARLTEEAEHVRALLRLHGAPIPDEAVVREPDAAVLELVLTTGRELVAAERAASPCGPVPGEEPPTLASERQESASAARDRSVIEAPPSARTELPSAVHRPRRARLPWREETGRLLRSHGQAMHYTHIAAHLATLGLEFGGRNPRATLLSYLSRDAGFISVGRGYWYLAGEAATPPAEPVAVPAADRRQKVRAISRPRGGAR